MTSSYVDGTSHDERSNGRGGGRTPASIAALVLKWLLVAFFAVLSVPKIAMVGAATEPFVNAGLPALFVAAIGLLELAGAIGLAVPRTTYYANVALMLLTVGAVIFHLAIIGGSPVSAVVAFALLGLLLILRRRA